MNGSVSHGSPRATLVQIVTKKKGKGKRRQNNHPTYGIDHQLPFKVLN